MLLLVCCCCYCLLLFAWSIVWCLSYWLVGLLLCVFLCCLFICSVVWWCVVECCCMFCFVVAWCPFMCLRIKNSWSSVVLHKKTLHHIRFWNFLPKWRLTIFDILLHYYKGYSYTESVMTCTVIVRILEMLGPVSYTHLTLPTICSV